MSEWWWHETYDVGYGPQRPIRRRQGGLSYKFVYPVVTAPPPFDHMPEYEWYDGPQLRELPCRVCGRPIVWCYGKLGDWMHRDTHREWEWLHLAEPKWPAETGR